MKFCLPVTDVFHKYLQMDEGDRGKGTKRKSVTKPKKMATKPKMEYGVPDRMGSSKYLPPGPFGGEFQILKFSLKNFYYFPL